MPTWQFDTHLNPNQTVSIPPEIVAQLPPAESVHVVLRVGAATDDADWQALTTEQFLQGYAPGDAIYDDLQTG